MPRASRHSWIAWALPASIAAHGVVAAAFFVRRPEAAPAPVATDPEPQVAGETFELPAPETQETALGNAPPSPNDMPHATPGPDPDEPSDTSARDPSARPQSPAAVPSPRAPRAARSSDGRAQGEDASASSNASSGLTYGAVGDRSATDLLFAVTHNFPQAASADPVWRTAALGSAGDATLTITLDETGHVASEQVGGAPSPALVAGIRRTMALVRGRPFVARGKVTTLHLRATVSADAVHDASGSDVFAVGRSLAGGEGHGWFALAIGRRVDLRVRVR
jgi:hypothetical protein